jgi:hypothetical protein
MKKFKIFLLILIAQIVCADSHIQIELLEKMNVKSKEGVAKAIILLENEKTRQIEKTSYILNGKYENSQLLDGKTIIKITWNETKKGQATNTLSEPFVSKLKTRENILAKSRFRANGDKSLLENSLNSLNNNKDSENEDLADKQLLENAGIETKDTRAAEDGTIKSLANNGGFGENTSTPTTLSSDSSEVSLDTPTTLSSESDSSEVSLDTPTTLSSDSSEVSLDTPTTLSSEIDSSEVSLDTVTNNTQDTTCNFVVQGDTVQFQSLKNGICTNVGSPVLIFESTNSCTPKIDYGLRKVQMSTKKLATFEGSEIEIDGCTLSKEQIELKSTFNGCDTLFRKDQIAKVQQEQLYYTYNNKDVQVGSCVDSTTIYPVSSFLEYNDICKPLISFENKTVQFAYRKVANVDDTLIELEPCKYELNTNQLFSTYENAGIVDDFINGESIQYERFFYVYQGINFFVGEPRPSTLTWQHYVTDETCTPVKISDESVVYTQRVAYKDNNGMITYITQCKPYSDEEQKLYKEFGGYKHDFVNNQSYPLTREYFYHPDTGVIKYINQLSKEAINFPHLLEHDHWENNDEGLYSTEFVKKYFKDTIYAKGNVYLDGLAIAQSPVPYLELLETTEFIKSLGFQRLKKIGDTYSYYSDNTKVIDTGTGFFPRNISQTIDITNLTEAVNTCDLQISHEVTYNTCNDGDIVNIETSYKYENSKTEFAAGKNKCHKNGFKKQTYTHKTCNKWQYYEEIGEYQIILNYLRSDKSIFNKTNSTLLRVIQ